MKSVKLLSLLAFLLAGCGMDYVSEPAASKVRFTAALSGEANAKGSLTAAYSTATHILQYRLSYGGLSGPVTWASLDGPDQTGAAAEIVPINLPFAFNDLTRAVGRIISPEAYAVLHDLVDNDSIPLDEDVRPRVIVGKKTFAHEYVAALRLRDELKQKFAQAMAGIDAFLTPTTGTVAIPVEEADQNGTPAHFTRFGNFLELCALALPNGLSAGLPTSLQIVCRGHDEATALRIGWAFQNATDWHQRRPRKAEPLRIAEITH